MNRRSTLRRQISEAWSTAITQDYQRQRINNERSLQASIWSRLNSILPCESRRMFIEPALVLQTSGTRKCRIPDIVVCNTKEVIGIIELKYLPRVKPNWKKDLDTLLWICEHRDDLRVQNSKYRGIESDGKAYPLSKDLLLVWAGVHCYQGAHLKPHIQPMLSDSFLELHAITQFGEHPTLK
jgi:hypothetical protein